MFKATSLVFATFIGAAAASGLAVSGVPVGTVAIVSVTTALLSYKLFRA